MENGYAVGGAFSPLGAFKIIWGREIINEWKFRDGFMSNLCYFSTWSLFSAFAWICVLSLRFNHWLHTL